MFSNLFCYICLKKLQFGQTNIRTQNATHTETPLKTYLEQFSGQFPLTANEAELDEIFLCEECLSKINDYDLACLTARNIESDLRNLLQKSKALTVKPEVIIKEESNDVIENEFQGDDNDGFVSSSDDEKPLNKIKKNIQSKIVRKKKRIREKAIYHKNNTPDHGSSIADNLKHCAICEHQTKSILAMKHHMIKMHISAKQEIVFRCQKCRMRCKNQIDLDAHLEKHKNLIPQNPLQCVECNKIFSCITNLYAHIPLHTGEFPVYTCELCGREFNYHTSFRRHKAVHANIKSKECDVCKRVFSDNSCLKRHMKIHNAVNKTPSHAAKIAEQMKHCAICGHKTKSILAMEHHMKRMHINAKQEFVFRCQKCRMTYKNQIDLNAHLKRHENLIPQNPLQCVECGKILSCISNLYSHIPLHNGEFPVYVCELCGREFNHHTSFRRHKKFHANIKTKECHICGRSFYENSGLKKHMRVHTGEKPHKCTECDRRFTTGFNMRSHMKLIHKIAQPEKIKSKTHTCLVCNKIFPLPFQLNEHLKRSHLFVGNSCDDK